MSQKERGSDLKQGTADSYDMRQRYTPGDYQNNSLTFDNQTYH